MIEHKISKIFKRRISYEQKTSNKITLTDSFQIWAHKWGRVGTLIALIYMVAVPFVVLHSMTAYQPSRT